MRIGVLLENQPDESTPEHFISKPLSLRFLAHFHNGKPVCQRVSEFVIRICQSIEFSKLKHLLRTVEPGYTRDYPERTAAKRTFWAEALLIQYPHKSQESQFAR